MTAPALAVQSNGVSQVSDDNFNTYVQTADSVAQLRDFPGTIGMSVYMKGFVTPGDGGQGNFYWNSIGTGPDDGGITNIVPTGSSIGCWTRILATGIGNGTVTQVSVATVNGVSGTVANATTTPTISIALGAITPSSVLASGAIAGSNLIGVNTGDQTITLTGPVTGAGTGQLATTIAPNAVTSANFRQSAAISIVGNSTNATANVADIAATAANQVLTVNTANNAISWQNTALIMGVITDATGATYVSPTTYTAGPYTLSGGTSVSAAQSNYSSLLPVLSGGVTVGSAIGYSVTGANISGAATITNTYGVKIGASFVSGVAVSASHIYGIAQTMPSLSSAASMVDSYGYQVTLPTLADTSTMISAYGVRIDSPTVPNTATLTNSYGVYIGNMGAVGITTSKAINIQAQSGSGTAWDLFIADGFYVKSDGTITHGNAALVTTATTGLLWLESCPGAPTGAASAPYTLAAAMIYDSTNNKIYVRCNGTWRSTAALT